MTTFDAVTHPYTVDGKYLITVSVFDNDSPTQNAASNRYEFVLVSTDILKTVYDDSKAMLAQGVVETIFSFAGEVVEFLAQKANDFVKGDWGGEEETHQLWLRLNPTTNAPELMVASTVGEVVKTIQAWEAQWKKFPAVLRSISEVRDALVRVTAAETAIPAPGKKLKDLVKLQQTKPLTEAERSQLKLALKDYAVAVANFKPTVGTTLALSPFSAALKAAMQKQANTGPKAGPLTYPDQKSLNKKLAGPNLKDKIVLRPSSTYTLWARTKPTNIDPATDFLGNATYTTDDLGRLETVKFTISIHPTKATRDGNATGLINKLGLATDIGFHILGAQFGGSTYYPNIIPANGVPNGTGGWAQAETAWAAATETNAPFNKLVATNLRNVNNVVITFRYGTILIRPDELILSFRIGNSATFHLTFNNDDRPLTAQQQATLTAVVNYVTS